MDAAPWPALTALVDPVRRALYDYVRRQSHPVTREEAADALDISRNLAAFHLDKLVDVGLLGARYEAPEDQPRGRGRTPKVYVASAGGVSLTIPRRQYELIASILAEAVAHHPHDAQAAAMQRARAAGAEFGRDFASLDNALAALGFEPCPERDHIILRNCPFHALAAKQPELVCALNHAFVDGLIESAGANVSSHLVPRPDACCVELRSHTR